MLAHGIGNADGYYDIYPDGVDGDPVTVYCDLTLGADYYMCEDCDDFNRFSPSDWLRTNALSYDFDWHPGVGYCDEGDWDDKNAGSLQECWDKCMRDDDFATACVNWNPDEEQCYCMGKQSDDDQADDQVDASDYCVRFDDSSWGVAVPRDTAFPGGCEDDYYDYDHECPDGMEPIIPRSREHWVRSVSRAVSLVASSFNQPNTTHSLRSFVSYLESVEGEDAGDFFQIIPGIYNSDSYGCGDCCYGVMNSDECGSAVATDGGPWWIGDEDYSEPNGNWEGGCFLSVWVPSAADIADGDFIYYDDTGCVLCVQLNIIS